MPVKISGLIDRASSMFEVTMRRYVRVVRRSGFQVWSIARSMFEVIGVFLYSRSSTAVVLLVIIVTWSPFKKPYYYVDGIVGIKTAARCHIPGTWQTEQDSILYYVRYSTPLPYLFLFFSPCHPTMWCAAWSSTLISHHFPERRNPHCQDLIPAPQARIITQGKYN